MDKKSIDFPHPVLTEYSNDFNDSLFSISINYDKADAKNIYLKIEVELQCDGIKDMLSCGKADIFARITCNRTFLRKVYKLEYANVNTISIPKQEVCDEIDIECFITATDDNDSYRLEEFNHNYFGDATFKLKKGDMVASEPGHKIKLDTILEKNASGVVIITYDRDISYAQVNFATKDGSNTKTLDYITIILPEKEYLSYQELRNKRYLKVGTVRFMQASIVLPAIVEGLGKLRYEEEYEEEPGDEIPVQYNGTIWADSIYKALKERGIEDILTCGKSDYELANLILGNVVGDAISELLYKAKEFSTVRWEGDDE